MVFITNHGAQRALERLGLGPREAAIVASEAYYSGLEFHEATGPLRKWLERLKERRLGGRIRVYEGFLFIFDRDRLVTCYRVPEHLLLEKPPGRPKLEPTREDEE